MKVKTTINRPNSSLPEPTIESGDLLIISGDAYLLSHTENGVVVISLTDPGTYWGETIESVNFPMLLSHFVASQAEGYSVELPAPGTTVTLSVEKQ